MIVQSFIEAHNSHAHGSVAISCGDNHGAVVSGLHRRANTTDHFGHSSRHLGRAIVCVQCSNICRKHTGVAELLDEHHEKSDGAGAVPAANNHVARVAHFLNGRFDLRSSRRGEQLRSGHGTVADAESTVNRAARRRQHDALLLEACHGGHRLRDLHRGTAARERRPGCRGGI